MFRGSLRATRRSGQVRRHWGIIDNIEMMESRLLLSGGSAFTIATLPDTQNYVKYYPDVFIAQTQWIADQVRAGGDIAFVSHLGDVVTRGFRNFHMENADAAMDLLDGVVPYSVAMGNHDYDCYNNDLQDHNTSANFDQWFGDARYAGQSWYGGSSPDQKNFYQIFDGGGRTFLHLALEFEAPDASLAWAQSVINSHRQLPVILTTHSYLTTSGRNTTPLSSDGGNDGEDIFQKLVKPNPQIFMVLCGHAGGEYHQVSTDSAGLAVVEIMADYSGRVNGGDGWLQLLSFNPAADQISVQTYTPYENQYETDSNSQFTIGLNFDQRFAFSSTGTPVGNDNTYVIATNGTASGAVLANDFDSIPATLTAALVSGPAHGTASLNADGTFTYTPAAGFHGTDTFTYTPSDGTTVGNVASVIVKVNDAPVAANDSASTTEYTPVTIPALGNDSDINGDSLAPIVVSLPVHGGVVRNADGTLTYTPHPKYTGADSFTYKVFDGTANSNVATVNLTVTAGTASFSSADTETKTEGAFTGSYTDTTNTDGVVESIQEVGGSAEIRWHFNVTAASTIQLGINSNCTPGEKWNLDYSTNGTTWTNFTNVSRPQYDETEPDEMFALPSNLSGSVWIRAVDAGGGADEATQHTLNVDEIFIRSGSIALPLVAIGAPVASAAEAGAKAGLFLVTRTGITTNALTVSYSIAGTATKGTDYSTLSGSVTIPAGTSSVAFSLTPIADSLIEGNETTVLTVSSSSSYTRSTTPATVTIADDTARTAPGNLAASAVSTTQINLTWTDNSSNESGFRIEHRRRWRELCDNRQCRGRREKLLQHGMLPGDEVLLPRSGLQRGRQFRLFGHRQRHHADAGYPGPNRADESRGQQHHHQQPLPLLGRFDG